MSELKSLGLFNYTLEYGGNFPSTNELYKIGRAAGGRSWLYLDPEVDKFKRFVIDKLREQNMDLQLAIFKDKDVMCNVKMVFGFSQNFWRRDVSNLVKATEDAIKDISGIDDRVTIGLDIDKRKNDLNEFEYLILVIEVFELDEGLISMSGGLE